MLYRYPKLEINQSFFRRPFTTFFRSTDHFSDGHRRGSLTDPERVRAGPWRVREAPKGCFQGLKRHGSTWWGNLGWSDRQFSIDFDVRKRSAHGLNRRTSSPPPENKVIVEKKNQKTSRPLSQTTRPDHSEKIEKWCPDRSQTGKASTLWGVTGGVRPPPPQAM